METAQRRVAENSLLVIVSLVTVKVLSLILLVFVARYLGGEGFGKYAFVYSIFYFLTKFTGFGLDDIIIREVARNKSRTNYYLVNGIYLKLFLCLVSWGILLILILVMGKGREVNLALVIMGLALLPTFIITSFRSVLMAHEMMKYISILEIMFRALVVGLGFMVIILDYGLVPLFLTFMVAGVIITPLWLLAHLKKIGSLSLRPDFTFILKFFRQAVPFALVLLFVSIYYRADTVMLSLMKGNEVVGWYNAAYGPMEALMTAAAVICTTFFPVFSRLYGSSDSSFKIAVQKTFKFLFFCPYPWPWVRPSWPIGSSSSFIRPNTLTPSLRCAY